MKTLSGPVPVSSTQWSGAATGLLRPPLGRGRSSQDTTPCSTCGDTKGKKRGPTGKDTDDRVLRQRTCSNGHVYVTVEVALPPDIYFSDVDYFWAKVRRESKRRRTGVTKPRGSKVNPLDIVIDFLFKRNGTKVRAA